MLFCRRRISGSSAAGSPVDASVTTAISGSTPSAPAKAAYQASYHCGCWNGVDGLMSFQRATACFQSRSNSTRNPAARLVDRARPVAPHWSSAPSSAVAAYAAFGRSTILPGWAASRRKSIGRRALRSRLTHLLSRSELLQHRLGEEGRPAQVAALRRVAEAMTQQAVGEVDDLGAADIVVAVGDRHRDVDGVEILDAVRRVQRPVQHLAGFEVEHLRMPVVPGRVGQIDLDVEQRDVLEVLRLDERRGVRIDVDPLAAGDLDQPLPRQIGMIIDLRIRRGDQDACLMASASRNQEPWPRSPRTSGRSACGSGCRPRRRRAC